MIHKKENIFLLQKLISIVLVLCLTGSTLHAGGEEDVVALEFFPQWYSKEHYTVQGNVGIEKDFRSNDWVKYYTKPSVSYGLDKNWGLHGGLGLYYTDNKASHNNFEIRPFQGISYFYPLTEKWKLSTYFRAEERFQYNTSTRDEETTLRLRLRLRANYMLNPLSAKNSWHKITLGVEGLRSNNDAESDAGIRDYYTYESLLTLGVSRNLSKKNRVRFELSWKYQEKPIDAPDSPLDTFYFKIQYYPVWGGMLRNKLFHRGIDE